MFSNVRLFKLKLVKAVGLFYKNNALWCNGSTIDFGSVSSGSSPLRVTKDNILFKLKRETFYDKNYFFC